MIPLHPGRRTARCGALLLLLLLLLTACRAEPGTPVQQTPTQTPPAATPAQLTGEARLALMEETQKAVKQCIVDFRKERTTEYLHKGLQQALPYSEPFAGQWTLRWSRDTLLVTVYRDFDVARAEALLQEFDCVRVERAPAPEPYASSVTRWSTRGVLTLEPARDVSDETPSTWCYQYTLDWQDEAFAYEISGSRYWVEVFRDDAWYRIPDIDAGDPNFLDSPWTSYDGYRTLQPGENTGHFLTSYSNYDFQPGRYRFVFQVFNRYSEYFAAEFTLEEGDVA